MQTSDDNGQLLDSIPMTTPERGIVELFQLLPPEKQAEVIAQLAAKLNH